MQCTPSLRSFSDARLFIYIEMKFMPILSVVVVFSTSLVIVTSFDLTIMHTNHIQAHIEEFDANGVTCTDDDTTYTECYGGIARRVTKVKEIRDGYVNPLLLDAGDHFQGTHWYTYYRGNATANFMNWIQYDAMAPSNHEFDDGPANFGAFLRKVTFPVLGANMDATDVPEMQGLYNKSLVLTLGEERVGIVGYADTISNTISAPGALVISDEITAIRAEVESLTANGINKIIVLGSSGLEKEREIAREVPGVDIIIGADHHQFLYTGTPPTDDEVTGAYPTVERPSADRIVLIVETSNFGQYLGLLEVTFDENGDVTNYHGNPILLDSSIQEDPETLAEVEKWAEPLGTWGDRLVGTTYSYLDGANPSCRAHECNLGNLITDAYLWEHVTFQEEEGWSDVSIAFTSSGAIRSSIPAGEIKLNNIMTVMPFEDTVDLIELRGHHILQALERSVEEYDLTILPGFFLQLSGIKVTYDLGKPIGSRVAAVEVLCSMCPVPVYVPLELEKVYKVVVNNYLTEGGDGYNMIPENMISHKTGRQDSEIVADYITKHSPVAPGKEGRITVTGEPNGAPFTCYTWTVALLLVIQHSII